ncbi:MAG: secretin N-terminal domain-containing protein [Gammaproteobacteria bacterium]
MRKLLPILIIISSLAIAPVPAAEMAIEVIPLQHRMVDDVISIIKPLVAEGGTVTGMNNQLIVKTTPANLAKIKQILKSIDHAPRRLMISVKQDIDSNINLDESGLSGTYASGDASVSASDSGSTGGLVIEGKDDDGNVIRYRKLHTRSRIEDKNTFRVQTLEGDPAYIATGQSVPVANTTTYVTPGGVLVQDGIEYRDVTSGFYVLPRLNGDQVILLVSPQMARIHPQQGAVFDIQNVETTVSGRLGEWIRIGGATQHFNDDRSRDLVSTRRRGQEQRTVLIRVDEIK